MALFTLKESINDKAAPTHDICMLSAGSSKVFKVDASIFRKIKFLKKY